MMAVDEDRVARAVRYVNDLSVAYHSWDEQLGESFDEWMRLSLRPWSRGPTEMIP